MLDSIPDRDARHRRGLGLVLIVLLAGLLAACSPAAGSPGDQPAAEADELAPLALPALEPAALDGRPLRVVATTGVIGDVVGQVGGDLIALTTLIGPGQDPHSYQPAAADLTAAAQADVIFVNGWNLEEGLVTDLADASDGTPLVPISAGLTPLPFGGEANHAGEDDHADEEDHGPADPHTWLSVPNVIQWADTAAQALSALDPANAATYAANAAAYQASLRELDSEIRAELEQIPPERRVLVTNHDAFSYFADEYGFEVLGTVIPSASTLAEPGASDMAALAAAMESRGMCTLFAETESNARLAETVAGEVQGCDTVRVLDLYAGGLGPAGSGADTYVGMMRANTATLVEGLR